MIKTQTLIQNYRRQSVIALLTALAVIGLLLITAPGAKAAKKISWNPLESFSKIAEQVSPAVVNIRAVRITRGGGRVYRHFFPGPRGNEDPRRDFFDRFFGQEQPREYKQRSLGSGFIIETDGYIVTNNHVVAGADEIQVLLKDGTQFDAKIIGRDPNTDIALIKIDANRTLPTATLGDSDSLNVGEWVVAIGSPFGLEQTVTAGIISAKGRVIGSGPYDDFLQTDASINPGNSGGPLINIKGDVIGINTAINPMGQGIGFAIPVNLARGVIDQLISSGEVTRGWLGVEIQELTDELAEYYGSETKKGALIRKVFEGDPADKAG
ncbi:MAG: trypsin-like peptidase domain-containing protein, partial [Deltaproteobacteria bacterium]|nr:trypsin-like peptidase domain-containing protein [Deltaproteobacteria bacterium]